MEIRQANRRELRWMKKLYLEAFPRSERKPFGLMKVKAGQGVMELLVVAEGKRLVGFAITVLHRDTVLLDYFAIHPSCQRQNHGSEALRLLKAWYHGRRLILEIELSDVKAPNQEARIRRKQFYIKNGMQETGMKVCLFGVPMEILTDGSPITYEEYHEIYRDTIGAVFAQRVMRL